MGHFLGGEKINFFNSRYCRSHHDGRAGGILSIRGPEVSPGPPMVGTRRGQSPTPHAWALPSVHTYKQGPLRSSALDHDPPKFSIQSSLGPSAPVPSIVDENWAGVDMMYHLDIRWRRQTLVYFGEPQDLVI